MESLASPFRCLTLLWQPDTVLGFNFSSFLHTLSDIAFPEALLPGGPVVFLLPH